MSDVVICGYTPCSAIAVGHVVFVLPGKEVPLGNRCEKHLAMATANLKCDHRVDPPTASPSTDRSPE
jgi:hypothetical protein